MLTFRHARASAPLLPLLRVLRLLPLTLMGCHSGAEPAPQTAATGEAAAANPRPPEASSAAAPPDGSSTTYAMCAGQHLPGAAAAAHEGAVQVQLAPAFLDEMPVCSARDALPHELIARATQGHINAKGDCEFADVGVTCHYHSGEEFVTSTTHEQTLGAGELHCIFPGADAKSPHVYGAHVMCRDHAQGEPHGEAQSHAVHAGASCSPDLLRQLEPCRELRCCDKGTLTNPIAELTETHRNDVRPDFRICSDTLEVDCDLLASLTTHAANTPALGGVGAPVFLPGAHGGAEAHRHQ